MPFVKVTGYLEVEDHEIDDGPLGPLTSDAFDNVSGFGDKPSPRLADLEDLEIDSDDR